MNIILNTKIGVDVSFRSLQKNYDAIFIAIGAQKALQMGIPGEDLEGVYPGLDFLKRRFLKRDLDFTGKKVAVIGGGNTAHRLRPYRCPSGCQRGCYPLPSFRRRYAR